MTQTALSFNTAYRHRITGERMTLKKDHGRVATMYRIDLPRQYSKQEKKDQHPIAVCSWDNLEMI